MGPAMPMTMMRRTGFRVPTISLSKWGESSSTPQPSAGASGRLPSGWPSGRGFVRNAAVSLSLLLGACATVPAERPIADPLAVAADLASDPDDAATLARLPAGSVRREGAMLTVTARRQTHRLEDMGACEGFGTCTRYRVDWLFGADVLGIRFVHGESPNSYFLLHLSDGRRMLDVETRPVEAPGGGLAVAANDWEISDSALNGVAVINLDRLRVLHHDRSLTGGVRIGGWEGRSCVRLSKGRDGEASQPLWLWTDGREWQTAADRPPACTPGA